WLRAHLAHQGAAGSGAQRSARRRPDRVRTLGGSHQSARPRLPAAPRQTRGPDRAGRRHRVTRPALACELATGYFGRGSVAESICSDLSVVPVGTRKGMAHENSGVLPTSTKETAVL